ncbi:type I-B CRISPR-associated protein Cas5b [Thermovirga lienii]|uniref:type I-B CRISPR-associated protein Cas5b n=1 Tax=Thermovirga lienii TaxID=336261 RepID=UPI002FE39198
MPVVFDVSGDIAMFRRPYTTTSSISYAFPPPSAIAGMIGAILGISKGPSNDLCRARYWRHMTGTQVTLKVINPIRWETSTINLLNTKTKRLDSHIQVLHQFVSNPKYRIFVKGPLEERLHDALSKGECYYTPYLGVAYALCELEYIGRFNEEQVSENEEIRVTTAIPFRQDLNVDVRGSDAFAMETVPFRLDEERTPLQYISVLFSVRFNKGIVLKEKGELEIAKCGEDVVAWFPAW